MKPARLLIPAALIAAIPTLLAAPEGRPEGPGGQHPGLPPMPPLIQALDKDEDGEISKSELQRASRALKRLDKNRDGELSGEEIRPPHPEGEGKPRPPRRGQNAPDDAEDREGEPDPGRQGPPPSPILLALDTDHDGTISEEELKNVDEALAGLDANEDGKLTRDELRPPRPDGQGPDGDGPPHGDGPPPHEGDDGDNDGKRRPGPPRPPRPER